MSNLSGKTVLVTGANRGIGAALVHQLLGAGTAKVYAAARNPAALPDFKDARVQALQLDITDDASVAAAAKSAGNIDVLINNAGVAAAGEALDSDLSALQRDMDTNYYGTIRAARAFAPLLPDQTGVIVNVVSVVGLTSAPGMAGYSASKAALQSFTQSLRYSLKPRGVAVLGVYPGPIDTDMARDLPWDKATPESAAKAIVEGVEAGETHIFPDPTAQSIAQLWLRDGRALDAALSQRAEALEEA
ncbi:MAG TPA: SDR family oxidoreductase [Asticcacaulis sp.]|nr:SDR family oxidoreductase [Asticcacaulis sp.]